jgi:plastocyanin
MEDTQKKVLIVVAILVVVGVAGYFLLSNQNVQEALKPSGEKDTPAGSGLDEGETEMGEEASKKTQELIEEVQQKQQEIEAEGKKSGSKVVQIPTDDGDGATTTSTTGVVVAEGSSPIRTDTGEVVTEEGKKADNTATPGTPDAPSQSFTTNEDDLPESTIKMKITPSSIEPAEFTVNAGQAVSLSITAAGDATEIFRFDTEKLKGVAVGVAPGKTRAITFNAPEETGEYTYYSDIANHRTRGAKGVMIVE